MLKFQKDGEFVNIITTNRDGNYPVKLGEIYLNSLWDLDKEMSLNPDDLREIADYIDRNKHE